MQTSEPTVSVVISVYRRAKYLEQAIQSALSQNYRSLEVIVTEDGCSREVEEVMNRFNDPRLRYIRNDPPLGAAANKLAAWRIAKGSLLVNLDDDDLIDPEFLSTLVPPLVAHPEATVSFCDHWIIDSNGVRDVSYTDFNTHRWGRDKLSAGLIQPFIREAIVDQSPPIAMGAVFRKTLIDDFKIESGPSYDLYLGYLACRDGQACWYTNRRLSSWRRHENQETGVGGLRTAPAGIFCFDQFERDPRLVEFRDYCRSKKLAAETSYGLHLIRADRPSEARKQLWHAIRHRPTLRAIAGLLISFVPQLVRQKLLGRRWRKE